MDTAILFPDAQRAARDLLRALLAGRSEPEAAGVTVSTRGLPGADEDRSLPYVQVRSDGKFRNSRLDGRATIRVIVWHTDEGLAEDLAALCEALILAATSTDIRSVSPVAGPIPTGDPDTGLPLSFFTITARLRPRQLTS